MGFAASGCAMLLASRPVMLGSTAVSARLSSASFANLPERLGFSVRSMVLLLFRDNRRCRSRFHPHAVHRDPPERSASPCVDPERSTAMTKMPPIPPQNRSSKGVGSEEAKAGPNDPKPRPRENLAEQGRQ